MQIDTVAVFTRLEYVNPYIAIFGEFQRVVYKVDQYLWKLGWITNQEARNSLFDVESANDIVVIGDLDKRIHNILEQFPDVKIDMFYFQSIRFYPVDFEDIVDKSWQVVSGKLQGIQVCQLTFLWFVFQ